jgi:DNA-binding XRE family transcriptional regulator
MRELALNELPERFRSKVQVGVESACWNWTGSLSSHGYGMYYASLERRVAAHRFAYETLVEPIPEGLQIDHLCRNRACVNPAHLEPVTQLENIRRGDRHRFARPDLRRNAMPEFSRELRQRREQAGLSRPALARLTGVSERSIAGYELGERVPTLNVASRFASALACSLDDLAGEGVPA